MYGRDAVILNKVSVKAFQKGWHFNSNLKEGRERDITDIWKNMFQAFQNSKEATVAKGKWTKVRLKKKYTHTHGQVFFSPVFPSNSLFKD